MSLLAVVILGLVISALFYGVASGYIHISTFKAYLNRRQNRKRLLKQKKCSKDL